MFITWQYRITTWGSIKYKVLFCVCSTLERLRSIWMEKVMTSMQGTLLLQQRISVKMTLVAPLSTSRSQHSGDSLVAVSAHECNMQTQRHAQRDFSQDKS